MQIIGMGKVLRQQHYLSLNKFWIQKMYKFFRPTMRNDKDCTVIDTLVGTLHIMFDQMVHYNKYTCEHVHLVFLKISLVLCAICCVYLQKIVCLAWM